MANEYCKYYLELESRSAEKTEENYNKTNHKAGDVKCSHKETKGRAAGKENPVMTNTFAI